MRVTATSSKSPKRMLGACYLPSCYKGQWPVHCVACGNAPPFATNLTDNR